MSSELWRIRLASLSADIDTNRDTILRKLDAIFLSSGGHKAACPVAFVPRARDIEVKDCYTSSILRAYEMKSAGVAIDGTFTALAATWEKDLQGDIIRPGAFAESIRATSGSVPLLFGHDRSRIVGLAEGLRETGEGLEFTGRLARNVQAAQDTAELLRLGAVKSFSIGFSVGENGAYMQGQTRVITKISLLEVSVVGFPANPGARLQ